MAEPSETVIAEFIDITNTSRSKAIGFLKLNNLDSNRAINAYFENPDTVLPNQPSWQQVTTDFNRTYGYQNTSSSSLNVEGSDRQSAYGPPVSRPPSTFDNREGRSNPEMEDIEQRQLREAVAMSLAGSQGPDTTTEQETGVVSTEPAKFGPATRDEYEDTAWAMTLLGPTSREVQIHPDPEERKRGSDHPAFIRPSEEGDYLAGFLTILHEIPLAREALLLRNRVLSDYGHNPQWWNGVGIPTLPPEDHEQVRKVDSAILAEIQRLMAFLDRTDRAFGSAESLIQSLSKSKKPWYPQSSIMHFLEIWQIAAISAVSENRLNTVFSSMAKKRYAESDSPDVSKEIFWIDINSSPGETETLYDCMDAAVWDSESDFPDTALDEIWFQNVSDIFTIRISNPTLGAESVGIKIPAIWYPDRYIEACKQFAADLRLRRMAISKEIGKLTALADRYKHPSTQDGLSNTISKAIAGASTILHDGWHTGILRDEEGKKQAAHAHQTADGLTEKLKILFDNIGTKVLELEEHQNQIIQEFRRQNKQLTIASDTPGEPPYHRYSLRGVCTLPHVTYVKRIERGNDNAYMSEQWWRFSFSVDDAKTRTDEPNQKRPRVAVPNNVDIAGCSVKRVREVEVLRAAKEESPSAILVYASEDAVNTTSGPLPPELQVFVDIDNETFKNESHEIEESHQQESRDTEMGEGTDFIDLTGNQDEKPTAKSGEAPKETPKDKLKSWDNDTPITLMDTVPEEANDGAMDYDR